MELRVRATTSIDGAETGRSVPATRLEKGEKNDGEAG
jgi:hypothetical protein